MAENVVETVKESAKEVLQHVEAEFDRYRNRGFRNMGEAAEVLKDEEAPTYSSVPESVGAHDDDKPVDTSPAKASVPKAAAAPQAPPAPPAS